MSRDNNDDFLEPDDGIELEEIDEHEYEISATSRPINWRRIELIKEKMWLQQQTDYFDEL